MPSEFPLSRSPSIRPNNAFRRRKQFCWTQKKYGPCNIEVICWPGPNFYSRSSQNRINLTPAKKIGTKLALGATKPQSMATTSSLLPIVFPKSLHHSQIPSTPTSKFPPLVKPLTKFPLSPPLRLSAANSFSVASTSDEELVFFDGGAHYGDLVTNLLLGFTLLWLPLTIAAVSRAFFLRYRFTNRRVTVISGLTGGDRTDFPYSAIIDVQVVPRLVGEWGDIVISLKDGTKVDLRSVPKFREIADYCLPMKEGEEEEEGKKRGGGARRGF